MCSDKLVTHDKVEFCAAVGRESGQSVKIAVDGVGGFVTVEPESLESGVACGAVASVVE